MVLLSPVLADEVNRHDGCRVVADRQATSSPDTRPFSRRDGGSRTATGGRVATVLCGARVRAQVRPGRARATVEIIGPVGEGVDCTEPGALDRLGCSEPLPVCLRQRPPRQGKHPCLQCGQGAAPVGNATGNRGDRSALVFDPQRETSRERRVSRWCVGLGVAYIIVEALATTDVHVCGGLRRRSVKPRSVSGVRSPC
jgi:hypothetical protein